MDLPYLLSELNKRGVALDKEGDRLKVAAPEGTITPEIADALRRHKQEILAILDGVASESPIGKDLTRVEERGSYPLSPSQERNLFSAQNGQGLPTAYVIKGPLDQALLVSVLDRIVERHATLRTVLLNKRDGVIAQVGVHDKAQVTILDFSGLDVQKRESQWRKRLAEAASEPFVLDKGPLYRFQVYRLHENEHILAIVFSQVVFDGASFDIFLKELTEGYSSLARGDPWPFPRLQIEYMDYVGWKHGLLAERGPELVAWWKKTLGNSIPDSPVPLDHPRPMLPDYSGGAIPLIIPADFADRLRALAKEQGVTTQVLLLGAMFILVSRLSGRPDCWIATPVEGRQYHSLEPLIGTFINLMLLKAEVDPDMPLRAFLQQLREYFLAAYDRQDVPIESLDLKIQRKAKTAPAPLFQVEFSYQQVSQRSTMMGPLSLSQVEVHGGNATNDLTLWVKDWGHMINGAFLYSATLFDKETIAHWLGCYLGILQYAVDHPEAPLGAFDLLAKEGTRVRAAINGSIGSLPRSKTFLDVKEGNDLSLLDSAGRRAPLGVWATLVSGDRKLRGGIRLKASGIWEQKDDSADPDGSADREFLLSQVAAMAEGNRPQTPPRNPTEERILAIWEKVLDKRGFGVGESFFDLGGHSLLALRLIKEMNESLGGEWSLRNLFETPTIEGLAGARSGKSGSRMPLLFAANRIGPGIPLFLIPGVYENNYSGDEGLSPYERDFLRYFNNILVIMRQQRPIYGLRPKGIYRGEKFRTTIGIMAREYVREIKAVQPQGSYIIGGECLGGAVAYEVARVLTDGGDTVSGLLLLDTPRFRLADEIQDRLREYAQKASRRVKTGYELFLHPDLGRTALRGAAQMALARCFPITDRLRERRRIAIGPRKYAGMLRRFRPVRYEGKVILVVNEAWNSRRESLGWDRAVCPNLEVHVVPGDHTTRLEKNSEALERCLRETLG
jgi:thioesterase domain-containing protein